MFIFFVYFKSLTPGEFYFGHVKYNPNFIIIYDIYKDYFIRYDEKLFVKRIVLYTLHNIYIYFLNQINFYLLFIFK